MEKKIKEIYEQLPSVHRNLAFFAHHLIVSLNQYKDRHVNTHGALNNVFFSSVIQCQNIVVDELRRASEHVDDIEARYEEVSNIKRLQEFKESVPTSHKDLAIFVQELMKRFDDLKLVRLSQIGLNFIKEQPIDRRKEELYLEVINEVESEIMQELEKTYEDIKNSGKPDYLVNYIDGIK